MKIFLQILVITLLVVNASYGQERDLSIFVDSFEKAKKQALEEKKDVLLVFSGSDWCKPCIIFDNNILEDDKFLNFAKQNLVIYQADFPQRKKNKLSVDIEKQNEKLASVYNKQGSFPKIMLFSADAHIKATLIYKNMPTEDFIQQIKKL